MINKTFLFYLLSFLISISSSFSQERDFPILKGPYLGQKPPGMTPEVFALNIIADAPHSVAVFSSDGDEIFWVPWSTLKMQTMKQVDGVWQKPQTISFAVDFDAENPWLSADGSRMYFTSTRPLPAGKSPMKKKFWNENIWVVERTADGWSEPKPISHRVNVLDLHWQISIDDRDHDLYFSASSAEEGGGSDIYQSKYADGEYSSPIKLGGEINTQGDEDTPFISSDGSYLIFARKPGADTKADLYISFRNPNESWRKAVRLDSHINSDAHEVCPMVTRDGKYFFFISMRSGRPLVYWVDAKIIEEMRPKE